MSKISKIDHSINKLIESIKSTHKLDESQLEVIQNEVNTTINRCLDTFNLTSDPVESNTSSLDNKFMVTSPINALTDIESKMSRCKLNTIELYISNPAIKNVIRNNVTFDDEGDRWRTDDISSNTKGYTYLGTLTRTKGIWSLKLDKTISPDMIDMTMYVRVWRTNKNNDIRNFINDVWNRLNGKSHDAESLPMNGVGQLKLLTNESIEDRSDEDEMTYEITYNPDEVIVYLSEHFDLDMDEDIEDPNEVIQDFFEALFHTDKSKVVQEGISNEAKILLKIGAAYAINKAAQKVIKDMPLIKHNLPSHNPYVQTGSQLTNRYSNHPV